MIKKIDHIAIASNDIEGAKRMFNELLGIDIEPRETVEEQGITTDIYDPGETKLEVMEPTDPDSPVGKFLEKKGEGIHHICFEVTDIEEMLQSLKDAGIELINEEPTLGAGGNKIAFLHPKSTHGVLIELSEPADRS
ncbi:MAG: methylmalonyl-CoA epimerase [Candidatus Marinimicrobia bacterium]|nr:methylmalonyl-CoA epimerase [Candidatus Neomarinimicrobiota bacterium]MCF7880252.1 methylmalonyl-CoA epimerase [Candidatus Neomarinimicrobiota bacterium]